jgi:hemolysin activation/secretion protein
VRSRLGVYVRLPGLKGFAHHVLALRLAAGATGGPLGERLSVGGVSSGSVDLTFGQSLGGTRAFPVRGYHGGELRGRRAATATVEYRLPLALVGKPLGHLPFGADKLWLNLFADAGDAWEPSGGSPRLTRLCATGVELAGDVTVNYDFPLQVRLGIAEPLAEPPSGAARRPRVYLAFASDF